MLFSPFFQSLLLVLLLITSSTQALGSGTSVYDCSCLLGTSCPVAFESTESLISQARRNANPQINELGRTIFENIETLEHGIAREHREAFRWELGQRLLDLHELISFQEAGVSEREVSELAETYTRQLSESSARYALAPLSAAHEAPSLLGAEFLPVVESTSSQVNIFVVQSAHSFSQWRASMGGEINRAIQRRLSVISERGHFGDVSVTQSETHRSAATIYELRLHIGPGPRIYYLQVPSGVVILGYSLKSEGVGAQTRAIRRSGELADAFLILQQ